MARPKKRPAQAVLLAEAAAFLDTAGKPEHAGAVREALADLTRSKARADNPTFTVYTFADTWRAAQQDCEQRGRSIPDVIDEGFAAFLAGRFKPRPAPRSSGKETFSARATADRRSEVDTYASEHADELGWTPSARQVAAAWLEHKFGPHKRT